MEGSERRWKAVKVVQGGARWCKAMEGGARWWKVGGRWVKGRWKVVEGGEQWVKGW